jgi:hypothetical protein
MQDLVKMVQSTLGQMETRLESRLGQLEHRVGEVGALTAEGFNLPGMSDDGGSRLPRASSGGGEDASKIVRMEGAVRLYQGYLGKTHPVVINLLENLSTELQKSGREDDSMTYRNQISQAKASSRPGDNGDTGGRVWCD